MRDLTPGRSRIIVFGDVFDDIVVVPSGPIRMNTDTAASIRRAPGGSAANTASWLGHLGMDVDFVGTVGEADVRRHGDLLEAHGVTPRLAGARDLPTGAIVLLVSLDDGESRSMLTERGANGTCDPRAVTDGLLDAATHLHLTGYSFIDARDPAEITGLTRRALAHGVTVSVDPASAGFIADFGASAFLDAIAPASVIFPNLDEGCVLTGLDDPREIAVRLGERFAVVVLTLGRDGVIVVRDGLPPVAIPADGADIVEPTGAGDAFCAGFLAAWTSGADARDAALAGTRVAALAVAATGGRPLPATRPGG